MITEVKTCQTCEGEKTIVSLISRDILGPDPDDVYIGRVRCPTCNGLGWRKVPIE
jgi:hypothetical protein